MTENRVKLLVEWWNTGLELYDEYNTVEEAKKDLEEIKKVYGYVDSRIEE